MRAPWFVDCHCHLLAGVDDGPATAAEALHLCSWLVSQGIRSAAATAHQLGAFHAVTRSTIREQAEILAARLEEEEIPLAVVPSAEWLVNAEWVEKFDDLWPNLLTVADRGRYALIEFPYEAPLHTDLVAERLASRQVRPILAHIDRYAALLHDRRRVAEMIEAGFVIQMNAGAICGDGGATLQRACRRLLRAGMVHVVASDAHKPRGRVPRLAEAYLHATRWVGRVNADRLFADNPQALLDGREPAPLLPRRWWQVFA